MLFAAVGGGALAIGADAGVGTNTSFAEHLAQVNRKVPEGFTVVVQPPFVVTGDEPPAQVRPVRMHERQGGWLNRILTVQLGSGMVVA